MVDLTNLLSYPEVEGFFLLSLLRQHEPSWNCQLFNDHCILQAVCLAASAERSFEEGVPLDGRKRPRRRLAMGTVDGEQSDVTKLLKLNFL